MEDGTEFLDLMKTNDDRWRFFLPLDCMDSIVEAIKMMKLIRDSEVDISNIDFFVGNLGLNQYSSSPVV